MSLRKRAFATALLAWTPAVLAAPAPLTLTVEGLASGVLLPPRHAFCVSAPAGAAPGPDISPALAWSAGPAGTRSYALFATDPDVPADFTPANQKGRIIAAAAARREIYHWALVDIPATRTSLDQGAESTGLVPHGKPVGTVAHGRRIANDYSKFLAGDPAMAGSYGGWDGPCPPWNDERVHHYHFRLYALSIDHLPTVPADAAEAEAAVAPFVLAKGETVQTYTLNPNATEPNATKPNATKPNATKP
jgi:phosphatidylethanolamine-binding protein (PEBP) family uncharacterized protein